MAVILVIFAILLAGVVAHHPDIPEDAQKACSHIKEQDICHSDCIYKYKYYGIIDKDGHYVESKMVDNLGTLSQGILTQEQVNKIAKECNSLNVQVPKTGCERALQVFTCIDEERFKIIGKHL